MISAGSCFDGQNLPLDDHRFALPEDLEERRVPERIVDIIPVTGAGSHLECSRPLRGLPRISGENFMAAAGSEKADPGRWQVLTLSTIAFTLLFSVWLMLGLISRVITSRLPPGG